MVSPASIGNSFLPRRLKLSEPKKNKLSHRAKHFPTFRHLYAPVGTHRKVSTSAPRLPVHDQGPELMTLALLDAGVRRSSAHDRNEQLMCVGCRCSNEFSVFGFWVFWNTLPFCAAQPTCFAVCFFLELTDGSTKSASATGLELGPCMMGNGGALSLFALFNSSSRDDGKATSKKNRKTVVEVACCVRIYLSDFKPFKPPLSLQQSC